MWSLRGSTAVHTLRNRAGVTGQVCEQHVLYRRGARPGDHVYVTGCLGDSAAGLDAILSGRADVSPSAVALVQRHLEPRPQLQLGQRIAASGRASAMIDVSDGISSDLGHICEASGVGCVLQAGNLPLTESMRDYCDAHALDAIPVALSGGEDYVLCVTGTPDLPDALGHDGRDLVQVGVITEGPPRQLLDGDGKRAPLEPTGWDSLRRR